MEAASRADPAASQMQADAASAASAPTDAAAGGVRPAGAGRSA